MIIYINMYIYTYICLYKHKHKFICIYMLNIRISKYIKQILINVETHKIQHDNREHRASIFSNGQITEKINIVTAELKFT
jgi:hypothetical protein